ncbi:MATE family efflux transporter [Oceanibacterium hippocampi]|uniref:DNA-damage-inducible protein F n=1 Tax=Oceanibacterium hippocampi TaxID=745714 RepID=A0A1Y5SLI7_9PROT|nr:MATE family efflux transporter [Oceanibacterium hippocampi]SLN43398.1 DNA-damage-inducible protein F [Oceanibacterium hippocampi]
MREPIATPGRASRRDYWNVWLIAWPVILSNSTVPLLGAVDTAVMGHLPEARYMGAVTLGATIFSLIYWGFGFLRMGTTGMIAQADGAGDGDEMRAALGRALLIAFAVGLAILALQLPILWLALWIYPASAGVEELTAGYFLVRVWSAPAVLANYCFLGVFIGLSRTRAALGLQVWTNGVNIALDLLFVVGFGWDVKGVALATVIADWSAMLIGGWMVLRMVRGETTGIDWRRIFEPTALRRTFSVNGDIFIRTLCLTAGFAYFNAESARFGDVVLAANAVLMNFQHILAYGLDGFAFAAEGLIGRAIGRRDLAAYRVAVRATTVCAVAVAVLYALFYGLFGPLLIDLLTDIESVRGLARDYLPWVIVSPIISIWSFQLDGIFIGATQTRDMRNAMILSLAGLVVAILLAVPPLGNHGLWLALTLFMVVRAITLWRVYPRIGARIG